jgi:hypothetical protein
MLRFQEGAETGNVSSSTTISAAADDGWNTTSKTDKSETFDNAFGSTPSVSLTLEAASTDNAFGIIPRVVNPSTTGFRVDFVLYDSSSQSTDQAANYIATQGR